MWFWLMYCSAYPLNCRIYLYGLQMFRTYHGCSTLPPRLILQLSIVQRQIKKFQKVRTRKDFFAPKDISSVFFFNNVPKIANKEGRGLGLAVGISPKSTLSVGLDPPLRGGTWVKFCWVCATGFSEPLLHYSLFWASYRPHLSHFRENVIVINIKTTVGTIF